MAGKKKVLEKVAGTFKSTLPQEERAGRGFDIKRRPIIDPVEDPPYPGIWESPRSLAESAAERVAPESGSMKQLFGVDRDDLYQISQRVGNRPGEIFEPKGSPRSGTAAAVMTPRNAQRMQDQLYEASKHPELYKGMHSWYVSDPIYSRLLQLVPKDEADRLFSRFNMFTGMSSPGSNVNTEIARGTAANYFENLGSFDLFKDVGGLPQSRKRELMEKAIADRNNFMMAHPEIVDVPGHPYHSTSQALPMEKMIANNYAIDMDSPKVPLYIQAFGDPRHPLGFQTDSAVPDAHFTRNIGISDIRRSENPGASASTSEYRPIRQWWRDQVTRPMGIEPVPGQAIVWGVGSKGTEVDTALGSPKLEIISDYIMRRAKETGAPPDVMRDLILQGKAFADGGAVGGLRMEAHRRRIEEAQRDRRERAVADAYARRERNDMLRDASDVMGQGIDFARENPTQAALKTGQFAFDMVRPHDMTDLGVMLAMSSVTGPFAGPVMRMAPKVGRMIAPMIGSPLRRATIGGGMIAADPEEMMAVPKYAEGGEVRAFSDGGIKGKIVSLGRGALRRIGEGTGYKSVPGKPATVEIPTIGRVETLPIPHLEDAASDYMQRIGRPGEHVIREYPEFDEELARRIARAYDEMKHDPSDPAVQRTYQALADETMAQLDAIKRSGLDIRFLKEGMADPYAKSPALGYADIVENNRLYTFPTDFGFGTTDSNANLLSSFKHPLLTPIGRLGDKDNAVVNDAFRVVHDAFGHFGPGNPFFRHKGEERAWLNHAPMYSPDARPAAANELRGQNSYVNFGPHAEQNAKASGADTIYADQKLGLMPEWTWTERSKKKPVEKADGGSVSGGGMNLSGNAVEREPLPKPEIPDLSNMSFEKAFATARRMGAPTFHWRRAGGKHNTFSTRVAESAGQIERRVNARTPAGPAPTQDVGAPMMTPVAPPGGEDQQPGLPMGMPTRNTGDTERMRAMLDEMMREERTREAEMPAYLYSTPPSQMMSRGGVLRRMQRAS